MPDCVFGDVTQVTHWRPLQGASCTPSVKDRVFPGEKSFIAPRIGGFFKTICGGSRMVEFRKQIGLHGPVVHLNYVFRKLARYFGYPICRYSILPAAFVTQAGIKEHNPLTTNFGRAFDVSCDC